MVAWELHLARYAFVKAFVHRIKGLEGLDAALQYMGKSSHEFELAEIDEYVAIHHNQSRLHIPPPRTSLFRPEIPHDPAHLHRPLLCPQLDRAPRKSRSRDVQRLERQKQRRGEAVHALNRRQTPRNPLQPRPRLHPRLRPLLFPKTSCYPQPTQSRLLRLRFVSKSLNRL